jgi:hypothetical protein
MATESHWASAYKAFGSSVEEVLFNKQVEGDLAADEGLLRRLPHVAQQRVKFATVRRQSHWASAYRAIGRAQGGGGGVEV